MKNKIIKFLKNPYILIPKLGCRGFFKWIPDDIYLKLVYKAYFKKKLDLKKPITFNQKLQWLKLYDRNPKYTKLVDKYEVREYIKKEIGEEYLIPLIGVYDNFDDINFDDLPNQFVLKCTHDSGGVVICKDKNKLNKESVRKKINKSLEYNYYYLWREWPYKNVKPRIICEQYMTDNLDEELKDYKFMCFNGEVKCLFVCLNRNSSSGLNVDFYNLDWDLMPFERHYKNSGQKIKKPNNFDKMIELARKLSRDIPFVRVDFYEVEGKVYFGELTFYPGSGLEEFTPHKYDEILGNWLQLPK